MYKTMIGLVMVSTMTACVEPQVPESPVEPTQWTVCEKTPTVSTSSWSLSYGGEKLAGEGVHVTEQSSESTDGKQRYRLNISLSTKRDYDTTGEVVLGATTQQGDDYTLERFVINDTNGARVEMDATRLNVQWIDANTVHVEAKAPVARRTTAIGESEEFDGTTFVMTASLIDQAEQVETCR